MATELTSEQAQKLYARLNMVARLPYRCRIKHIFPRTMYDRDGICLNYRLPLCGERLSSYPQQTVDSKGAFCARCVKRALR
jgi:hypothetical protein